MFNFDGHMYTTFLVASFADIPHAQAYLLTYYSQLPDMDCRFDATYVSIIDTFFPWRWAWRRDITEQLHSLHGGDNAQVQRRRHRLGELIRRQMLKGDDESVKEAGLLIHAFGDSYAHTKGNYNNGSEEAYGTIFGHGLAGHHPDQIVHPDVFPKYEAYVRHLFEVLETNKAPQHRKLMDDYLCSLRLYICADKTTNESKTIETMERAIVSWSLEISPGFCDDEFDELINDHHLTEYEAQKVMDEIKRESY